MSLPAAGMEMTQAIRPCQKFEGHTDLVEEVIHLQGGQRIMTCARDGSLRVWNLESGKQIGNDWRDGKGEVVSIALSPDGQKVVSGSGDGAVKLWDMDTGKIITKWTGHKGWVPSMCWNRDSERVLSVCADGTTRMWDVDTGEVILAIKTGFNDVWAVVYSPDETMIATGGCIKEYESEEKERRGEEEEECIKIWDSKTGKLVTKLKGHTRRVYCLAWTGSTLISGSEDETIRTWNTTTWQQINVWTGHTGRVCSIAISPNGRILASTSEDHTARLWNLENSQPIGSPLQHADMVWCASFSTDGKLLATACYDNNAYTWDVSAIVTEAGLAELLLPNPNDDNKLLDANATRRPRQRRENIDDNRLPPSFFKDSYPHAHPSRRRPSSPSFTRQHYIAGHLSPHERTLLGRISSLFWRNHHDTTPPPRFLRWARNPFFSSPHTRNDGDIVLQESRPAVVDVPSAQGNPRNYSAREVRMKKEKEKEKAREAKNAKHAQSAPAGSSRPPQGNVTQQSGGAAQAQAPSDLPAAVAASSTTPPIVANSAVTTLTTSVPDAVIPRAGCWIRFWLFVCCASAQYTDSHY